MRKPALQRFHRSLTAAGTVALLACTTATPAPEYFRSYLVAERRKWSDIIQKQGIKAN